MSREAQIILLTNEEGLEYGCSPCAGQGRDVDAVAVLEGTYGVLDDPCLTYLCGHHAEVLHEGATLNEDESEVQG